MYLVLGISHMESGDCETAIRLFRNARARMRPHTSQALLVISLVSLLAILQRIESILWSPADIWMEI